MTVRPPHADLPPQLHDLSAKAQYLPEALRNALRAALYVAPSGATPEDVLTDTFAQLGYLPDEAKQTALKILAEAPAKPALGSRRDATKSDHPASVFPKPSRRQPKRPT